MKDRLKRIFIFSIVLLLTLFNSTGFQVVNAITILDKNIEIEIYEIKEEKEVGTVENIIGLYKTDPNNKEFLEYKQEQAKIEMENYRLEKAKQERIAYKTKIVNFAKQFVGNPYVSGGTSLTNGADCSGFVQTVYATFGIKLPRTTDVQAKAGMEVSIDEIEVGDIVSYGYDRIASHSAIYIGDGRVVHASTPELGIRTDRIDMMPIVTIRRVR